MARRYWEDDVTPINADIMNDLEDDVELGVNYRLRVGSVATGPVASAEVSEKIGNEQQLDLVLPTDTERGYLVANFGNNFSQMEKLSVHFSPDGEYVMAGNNNPVYAPAGGVRDPQVYRHPNGRYYCAYTVNNGADKVLGLAVSDDFVNWTLVTKINVAAATGITRAWAPQVVEDTNGDVYMFFTNVNETTTSHSIWRVKATSANLTTWSAPAAVVWAPAPALQPGKIPIDAVPFYALGKWWIFFGAETGQMWRATATKLTGTWTVDRQGDWAGWVSRADLGANTHYEAPEILEVRPGVFRLYMDRYVGTAYANYNFAGYVWSETTDFNTWTAPEPAKKSPDYPGGQALRHGTWMKIKDGREQMKVIAATMGGKPIQHAEFEGTTTKGNGNAAAVQPTLVLDPLRSNRADDFVQAGNPGQLKILVDGVYSIDFVLLTTPGTNLGGGWMAIKSPDEVKNYATNDFPSGAPAWSVSASNVLLLRDELLRFFGQAVAAFPTAGVLKFRVRITKVQ